ncbi:DUF2971 domain-containing protein [Agarivorans sp. 1_MG-2023]|uniref:DUF2971 domain-containing protein n=1 Tax=Agarivorans sp. 1_MG-2023 TaxID=3062634 RepID=UPI0026E20BF2|nr:DUF2971 domain-containing protein [Agarivorans sp. 1_MG-2023]MDO6763698.1 DUF2971 domain-containing protein [Agarivorans sp. 1_MG-2023]
MSHISDKEIEKHLKRRRFSRLQFLKQTYQDEGNEKHIGYYYFLLMLRYQDTSEVFEQIILRRGCESQAYSYLGNVAESSFDGPHVAKSFYRKALALDENNTDAHWGLYIKERNEQALHQAVRLTEKAGNHDALIHMLINVYYEGSDHANFPIEHWKIVKREALSAESQVAGCLRPALVLAYFYLEEYPQGVQLIKDQKVHYSPSVLRPYEKQGLLSSAELATKVWEFELDKIFGDNKLGLYLEKARRSEQEGAKVSQNQLLRAAFDARAFDKVTYHYQLDVDSPREVKGVTEKLFYLYAQVELSQPLDHEVLTQLERSSSQLKGSNKAWFCALKCKRSIANLRDSLQSDRTISLPARNQGLFQDAEKQLKTPELLSIPTYEELKQELNEVAKEWDEKLFHSELKEVEQAYSDGDGNDIDLLELAQRAANCRENEKAINAITEYEKQHTATMSSQNTLAVCYERIEEHKKAMRTYSNAINLMRQSGELDLTVINNYILCNERSPTNELEETEIATLNREFNLALIESYKWHTFTAKAQGRLFKYSPFNINTIDSLTNLYFYLPSKEQLNDPMELSTETSLSKSLHIDENLRICCFSNDDKSTLMWAHYSQEHQGVMVEYWFGGELPDGVGFSKVNYTHETQREKEKEEYLFDQFLLTKNKAWAYEDEVRLFTNKSHKLSYEAYDYPDFDREKINARVDRITMGYKFPGDKKQLLQALVSTINAKRKPHEPKVSLQEAYLEDFTIKYRKYPD